MSSADETASTVDMIRHSAAALKKASALSRARSLRFTEPGYERATVKTMAEQGWIAIRAIKDDGGNGLGVLETCALMEELGTMLTPEPLASLILSSSLLGGGERDSVIAGERIVIPAWQEHLGSLHGPDRTEIKSGKLNGTKSHVYMAAGADAFIVRTRTGAALVRADAPGLTIEITPTQDGGNFGWLTFREVPAEAMSVDYETALEEAALYNAAYLAGVMRKSMEITLDYMRVRKQFGKPIGSFQSLQHRAADMHIQMSLSRASTETAAITLDRANDPNTRRAAVSRAVCRAIHASLYITRQAIQLHGAIGYTDEHDIGAMMRKALTLSSLYGSVATHRRRFAHSEDLFGVGETDQDNIVETLT